MFVYSSIDPIAVKIGPLAIHWYGLMYIVGIAIAWLLGRRQARRWPNPWTNDQINDLAWYVALGVILGGRVGYMLFYNFSTLLAQPWKLFAIWEGGMSFHGGFLGVLLAVILYSRKYHKTFAQVGDFCAPLIPPALGLGRIGNFINGELWGRATDVPWGVVFPHVDELPRHPSQLYEFFLEGVVLFIILRIYSRKPRPDFAISSLFLIGYGTFRFIVEFFREPDLDLGFIAFHWLTMGQLLSLPMIIVGILGLVWAYRRNNVVA